MRYLKHGQHFLGQLVVFVLGGIVVLGVLEDKPHMPREFVGAFVLVGLQGNIHHVQTHRLLNDLQVIGGLGLLLAPLLAPEGLPEGPAAVVLFHALEHLFAVRLPRIGVGREQVLHFLGRLHRNRIPKLVRRQAHAFAARVHPLCLFFRATDIVHKHHTDIHGVRRRRRIVSNSDVDRQRQLERRSCLERARLG